MVCGQEVNSNLLACPAHRTRRLKQGRTLIENFLLLCQVRAENPPWTLDIIFSDLAANMIGRSNARRGARRIFAVVQNRRLNQHIAYTIIDEVSGLFQSELSKEQIDRFSLHCFQKFPRGRDTFDDGLLARTLIPYRNVMGICHVGLGFSMTSNDFNRILSPALTFLGRRYNAAADALGSSYLAKR